MSRDSTIRSLPLQEKIGSIEANRPDDLFLACASYEPRSISVIDTLADDYSAKKGVIYVNGEFLNGAPRQSTRGHLAYLKEQLSEFCESVQIAKGSWLDPENQLEALKNSIGLDEFQAKTVSLDITTFNREALFVTLNLLYTHHSELETRIFYVKPESYGEWLSRGHREIRNILGFSGFQKSSKPTLLVILSGFERDRTLNVIEEYEPSKVLLGIGDEPTGERFLQRNLRQQDLVLSRQDTERFDFSTTDIEECSDKMCEIISKHSPSYNIVIAPMSSKLSTIGVWLAARRNMETQVIYSIPNEYNIEDYSTGQSELFIDFLPQNP